MEYTRCAFTVTDQKASREQVVRRHGYKLCYTVTRLSLQAAGRGGPIILHQSDTVSKSSRVVASGQPLRLK
jgi:hypothetical protein